MRPTDWFTSTETALTTGAAIMAIANATMTGAKAPQTAEADLRIYLTSVR